MSSTDLRHRRWLKLSIAALAGKLVAGFSTGRAVGQQTECASTPIQELGPYAPMQFRNQPDHDIDLVHIKGRSTPAIGQLLIVKGTVKNKHCEPVSGAVVEIWQANHFGKYHHEYPGKGEDDPGFQGWGQAITNKKGEYRFTTVLPGEYGSRARHIHFKVSRRGYHELITQLYFEGEERNKTDGILNQLPHEEQQLVICRLIREEATLLAEFPVVITAVEKGRISERVVKEYAGQYRLEKENGFAFRAYISSITGKNYQQVLLQLTQAGTQLFMEFPFSPRAEIGWHAKDEFESWSFYNSWIRFQRNEQGKITGLQLHFSEEQFVLFLKQ